MKSYLAGTIRYIATAILCLGTALCAAPVHAQQTSANGTITIAYFEAGSYWEFSLIHQEVLEALKRRNVLHRIHLPKSLTVSPGWDADEAKYRAEARKLMNNKDVALILSMGTAATKALLAENNGKTPIMSIDVADPVGAGFVNPETEETAPNLTIQYEKDKWYKVFMLFHQALPFSKLGIMYHDSPEGLSYSNVREAREVARERGFTLVEYPSLDKAESMATCTDGINTLLTQNIDALYISALNCFDWTQGNPQPMFDALHKAKIKTFARDGSIHVRRGALMGLSTVDYTPLGEFYADRIALELGLLPQNTVLAESTYTPKITLNLVTASNLGIDVPLLLLISADEIFDSTLAAMQNATMAR